jgi:hypothetical protein
MTFEAKNLHVLNYAAGFTQWLYRPSSPVMFTSDYFVGAKDLLAKGDMILVSGVLQGTQLFVTEDDPHIVVSDMASGVLVVFGIDTANTPDEASIFTATLQNDGSITMDHPNTLITQREWDKAYRQGVLDAAALCAVIGSAFGEKTDANTMRGEGAHHCAARIRHTVEKAKKK